MFFKGLVLITYICHISKLNFLRQAYKSICLKYQLNIIKVFFLSYKVLIIYNISLLSKDHNYSKYQILYQKKKIFN